MSEFSLDINEIKEDVDKSLKEEEEKLPNDEIKKQADDNAVAIFELHKAVNSKISFSLGKIAEPVKGATLIGKGEDILKKIDMVGNDLALAQGMCGAASGSIRTNVGQPTIRVSEILVGGRGGELK